MNNIIGIIIIIKNGNSNIVLSTYLSVMTVKQFFDVQGKLKYRGIFK